MRLLTHGGRGAKEVHNKVPNIPLLVYHNRSSPRLFARDLAQLVVIIPAFARVSEAMSEGVVVGMVVVVVVSDGGGGWRWAMSGHDAEECNRP